MKKFALTLMAALTVFGSSAYVTPAHATTDPILIPDTGDGSVMVVYFDHYPPSTYIDDNGFYGFLINVRQVSGGLYEGTYVGNY
ncbi:hypothetical protein [Tumebacillus permanentifrigoris]|uniref:Uncharacterized protein n=1 Tax=Tumebacillus permanentifrigoris TaxID=378543 RepID=A0A316D6H6_9BACL|nr:hypothetical protein [Tumebacillus permanentifrigoris]PWK07025.1 hypothetical protein C7459_11898 [Tumebacillus permanentifrigoris]